MNLKAVFHLIAYLLVVTGAAILCCALVAIGYRDPMAARVALLASGAAGILGGGALAYRTRGDMTLSRRDGFLIVTLGWLVVALLGSVPYLGSGVIRDPAGALFETLSGFTTTGASVLSDLESIPRGILFWRALTQWLGGMGVLVLCVAILPFLGVGGMQVYRAEIPGPSKDRLTPRIAMTAKLLWVIYVLMSLAQAGLLTLGGMSLFEACCHTFTTMSTGGFSTRTASVAAFDSVYLDTVFVVFMFLAGTNFALHFRMLRGNPGAFYRDSEFRVYVVVWLVSCIFLSINIRLAGLEHSAGALRHGFFQGTSILTTTGFVTRDFNIWPHASRILLVLMMFIGGCGGSTAGGVKAARVLVLAKHIRRELLRVLRPHTVARIKLRNQPVEESAVANTVTFALVFCACFAIMSFLMSFYTPDLVTATSAVAAALGNIGPGLGAVGATETYAFIAAPGKLILVVCMLLGRLEFYTILLLFMPSFWRK